MAGYTVPDLALSREYAVSAAGGAATTAYGKLRSINKLKLTKAKAWVTVAGTATGHKFDIMVGTNSVGSLPLGTEIPDTAVEVALNVEVAAGAAVTLKSGADATGKADVVLEYRRND